MLKIRFLLIVLLGMSSVAADFPPPALIVDAVDQSHEDVNPIEIVEDCSACRDIALAERPIIEEPIFLGEIPHVFDVNVEITADGRSNEQVQTILGFQFDYESAQFTVLNKGVVEFEICTGSHGCVSGLISTEKPEFIEVLRRVTPEDEKCLTSAVIVHMKNFLQDETACNTDCDVDAFYEKYEQAVAVELEAILNRMVWELEGAKAMVTHHQKLIAFICPIIDQEFANIDPEKTSREALWEVGINITNAVFRFTKEADLALNKVFDAPIKRISMEIRIALMNCMNQAQQDFVIEAGDIDDLVLAQQKIKEFWQKVPVIVFTRLKDFYPALDESMLNEVLVTA